MTKKTYMKPTTTLVKLQNRSLICASQYGMNDNLQNKTVTSAWSRESRWVDDDEE